MENNRTYGFKINPLFYTKLFLLDLNLARRLVALSTLSHYPLRPILRGGEHVAKANTATHLAIANLR